MRILIAFRVLISLITSAVVGTIGARVWPYPVDQTWLALIATQSPTVSAALAYTSLRSRPNLSA